MNVALVEWYWSGHHPTFFAHFVLSLEELGCRVLAICPQPAEARKAVEALRSRRGSDLLNMSEAVFLQLPEQRRSFLPTPQLRRLHHAIMRFRGIDRLVLDWGRRAQACSSLVFYACIYDWDFWDFRYARPFLRTPWSGLYLHPRSFRKPGSIVPGSHRPSQPRRIFSGRALKSVGILDEGIPRQVAQALKRPVVVFPDLTDQRLPATAAEAGLATKMRTFAAGRHIVGIFGHLQKTKGVMTLTKMIGSRRWENVCFALAGEITWNDFRTEDRAEISAMLTDNPLVWSYLARISDEPRFNGLLSECDVLFAAYLNFPHSSNILTKAAFLRKPVIVSDGYLMAERVRRYRLGEVVPEGDFRAAAAATQTILTNPSAWVAQNSPDWLGYLERHSFDALKAAFSKVLAR